MLARIYSNNLQLITRLSLTTALRLNYNLAQCATMSDEVLAWWLSVCSEVQMICIWPTWCRCHPIVSCCIKIQIGVTFLMPANPSCPGKHAIKQVSVWYYNTL